jgi:hypothetical protein
VKGTLLAMSGNVNRPDGKAGTVTLLAVPSREDREAFRAAAGAWKGTIDAEALIRNLDNDRLLSTRPETPSMTIAYLLETAWVSHDLHGHAAIVARWEERQEPGLALSVLSLAALCEGGMIPGSRRRTNESPSSLRTHRGMAAAVP